MYGWARWTTCFLLRDVAPLRPGCVDQCPGSSTEAFSNLGLRRFRAWLAGTAKSGSAQSRGNDFSAFGVDPDDFVFTFILNAILHTFSFFPGAAFSTIKQRRRACVSTFFGGAPAGPVGARLPRYRRDGALLLRHLLHRESRLPALRQVGPRRPGELLHRLRDQRFRGARVRSAREIWRLRLHAFPKRRVAI